MRPYVALDMFMSGSPQIGWLNALNASSLNCRLRPPAKTMFSDDDRSVREDAGSDDDVAPGVPVGERVGTRERGGVEPLLDRLRPVVGILARHEVRTVGLGSGIGDVGAVGRIPGEAAGLVDDGADLPAAQDRGGHAVSRPAACLAPNGSS